MNGRPKLFNLNYSFSVQLTDAGYQLLKEGEEEYLPEEHHRPVEEYKARADADGFVSIQAWRFLHWFGGERSALGVATRYYSLEIRIKTEDLFVK